MLTPLNCGAMKRSVMKPDARRGAVVSEHEQLWFFKVSLNTALVHISSLSQVVLQKA